MNQEQLRKKIEYSLQEGFTEQEVRQVLREQGIRRSRINQAFNQIRNGNQSSQGGRQESSRTGAQQTGGNPRKRSQGNQESNGNQRRPQKQAQQGGVQQGQARQPGNQQAQKDQEPGSPGNIDSAFSDTGTDQQGRGRETGSGGAIPGLDLTDSFYRVKQSFLLRRYSVYDQNGEQVLKAKNKILSLKTRIPFRLPGEEEDVFKVESERLMNISNNYNLTQEGGDDLAVIDRKRTIFNQVWRVRDPDDNSIAAKIKTASQAVMAVRIIGSRVPFLGVLTSIIPHTYEIEDNNGQKIGELEGQLSIRDTYDLKLQDSGSLDREAMIAAVISIDAIEGQ